MVFWVATGVLTAVLVAIAVIDLRTFRIPDLLSLPLIAAGLILAWTMPLLPFWHHIIGAAAGFAVLAGIGEWYFHRRGIDGLGLGDAKLFAAAGAWLGWQGLPMVLMIAALGGLAFALLRGGATRVTAIAFGPWLALGFWLVWLWTRRAGLMF
jgi:leader peptidase (prepilin peptidase) / N-methyltransferase